MVKTVGPLVLIVDDDCDTCLLLGHVLEFLGGFRTSVAYTLETANICLDAVEPPALVVVDYVLGPSNGDVFSREVAGRDIPTFLITAASRVCAAVQTPVVLFKPFDSHMFCKVATDSVARVNVPVPRTRELQSAAWLADFMTSTNRPTAR